MKRVKSVNSLTIYMRTREEMNKILLAKGDWGIEYYVPGRVFKGYVINTYKDSNEYSEKKVGHEWVMVKKKIKVINEFTTLESAEKFCRDYMGKKMMEKLTK